MESGAVPGQFLLLVPRLWSVTGPAGQQRPQPPGPWCAVAAAALWWVALPSAQVCRGCSVQIHITHVCVLLPLSSTAADLFTDLENAFQGKIDAAYFETSKYLLDVLNKKYSLLDHMQAMRRYLLLGQGDFIRHLMDLLK